MSITKITDPAQLQMHDGITMYTFSSPTCVPCKYINPIMDRLAGESDYIHVYRIDATVFDDLAIAFGVTSVPTVFIWHDRKLKHTLRSVVGIKHQLESLNA